MFDNFYETAGNEFFKLYNFAWVALPLIAYIISKRYFPSYKYAFVGFFFGAVSLPLSGAVLMIVDNKIAFVIVVTILALYYARFNILKSMLYFLPLLLLSISFCYLHFLLVIILYGDYVKTPSQFFIISSSFLAIIYFIVGIILDKFKVS
jgi:hypothetical protein